MVQNEEINIIQDWLLSHVQSLTEHLDLDKSEVTYSFVNGRPSIIIKAPGKIYELNCNIEVV